MAKYKIQRAIVEASRPIDIVKQGDIDLYSPKYPDVDIPEEAVGVTVSEEIILTIPPGTPQPPPGLEQVMMDGIRKKYTRMLCHVRYLVPIK